MTEFKKFTVRDAAILTNGYVAGTVVELSPSVNQIILNVAFTIGSLTDMQIKVEFSDDNSTFYREMYEASAASSGNVSTITVEPKVHKIAATCNLRLPIPVKDRYVKVSFIGTGTVTSSSAAAFIIADNV